MYLGLGKVKSVCAIVSPFDPICSNIENINILFHDFIGVIPWIPNNVAHSFLRTRRNARRSGGGSITQECCTRVGCTWEEYAEYCPSNKRINN